MKGSLVAKTLSELVAGFAEIGVAQDKALLGDQINTFNRLYSARKNIEAELKRREPDQRIVLMSLYRHENMQVRLNAANATLAVAPVAARALLTEIRASKWHPQALDAGMCLRGLEDGTYRPS